MAAAEEWTAQECADAWGVKPPTWRSYVSRGQAPQPVRRIGSTPLWNPAEVTGYQRPGSGARTDLHTTTPKESPVTVTLQDMIDKIGASVSANGSEYAENIDIEAIAHELIDLYGYIDIDATTEDGDQIIPFATYWAIVDKHDSGQQ